MDNVNQYLQWISSQIGDQERYHAHKETIAWTATAFYLSGIIALGYNWKENWCDTTSLILFIPALLVFAFLYMQFRARWEASDAIRGLIHTANNLCNGTTKLNIDNCVIEHEVLGGNRTQKVWPKFVQDEIDKVAKEVPRTWRSFVAALWNWKTCRWGKECISPKWLTEIPSYIICFLATIFAIALAWIDWGLKRVP